MIFESQRGSSCQVAPGERKIPRKRRGAEKLREIRHWKVRELKNRAKEDIELFLLSFYSGPAFVVVNVVKQTRRDISSGKTSNCGLISKYPIHKGVETKGYRIGRRVRMWWFEQPGEKGKSR